MLVVLIIVEELVDVFDFCISVLDFLFCIIYNNPCNPRLRLFWRRNMEESREISCCVCDEKRVVEGSSDLSDLAIGPLESSNRFLFCIIIIIRVKGDKCVICLN